MKALSLWQPWAELMANGTKAIETRSWCTNYRGPLAIHAATSLKGLDSQAAIAHGLVRSELLFGYVVAYGELVNCVKMTEPYIARMTELERELGDWEVGRWAWILYDVQRLAPPFKVRGRQGLFDVDLAMTTGRPAGG